MTNKCFLFLIYAYLKIISIINGLKELKINNKINLK